MFVAMEASALLAGDPVANTPIQPLAALAFIARDANLLTRCMGQCLGLLEKFTDMDIGRVSFVVSGSAPPGQIYTEYYWSDSRSLFGEPPEKLPKVVCSGPGSRASCHAPGPGPGNRGRPAFHLSIFLTSGHRGPRSRWLRYDVPRQPNRALETPPDWH